jgi:thioredoxin 1
VILTDENFEQAIKSNGLVLVDFWAEWCGPCKKVSPILDEISEEHGILVGKLNIDENPIKPVEFLVSSIPTMVLFESGVVIKTIVGAKPKHKMLEELSPWL